MGSEPTLTKRQKREVEYHREHAARYAAKRDEPVDLEIALSPTRRWWNGYWHTYTVLRGLGLPGKRALVVGCGFGDDAIRLARLGAEVSAFDLSPDSLAIAAARAGRDGVSLDLRELPAESLDWPDDTFDVILCVDILHHVDIPRAIAEIRRVARPGAVLVVNEIYTHGLLNRVRTSRFVEGFLYRRMVRFVYGTDRPYITEDERKIDERELAFLERSLEVRERSFFNFLAGRLFPVRFAGLARVDRAILRSLGPLGTLLAGRVVLAGALR